MQQGEHAEQQDRLEKILGVTAKEMGDAASEEALSLAVGGKARQELESAYADARIRCRAEVEAAYEAVFDKIADAPVDLRPVKEAIEALNASEPSVVMAAIGAEIVAHHASCPVRDLRGILVKIYLGERFSFRTAEKRLRAFTPVIWAIIQQLNDIADQISERDNWKTELKKPVDFHFGYQQAFPHIRALRILTCARSFDQMAHLIFEGVHSASELEVVGLFHVVNYVKRIPAVEGKEPLGVMRSAFVRELFNNCRLGRGACEIDVARANAWLKRCSPLVGTPR
jgi:hypothetical protein